MQRFEINLGSLPLPIALHFLEPVSDEHLLAFSEANKPFRCERFGHEEIRMMTPVGNDGGKNEMYVSGTLFAWNLQANTGQTYSPNTGFTLPDGSCLAPDACWVPLDAYRKLTRTERRGYASLCPPFVIEVRSQSDSRRLLEEKMQVWIANGAKLAWLVDPIAGDVMIFRPGEPTETLERPDVVMGHEPVEGFSLDCTPLWDEAA